MSALAWILTCIFGVIIIVASFAITPSHCLRRLVYRDKESINSGIRTLKKLRVQIVIGEVLLIGAFVILHNYINSHLLYPLTILVASTLLAFRQVMTNAVEAMHRELRDRDNQQSGSRVSQENSG